MDASTSLDGTPDGLSADFPESNLGFGPSLPTTPTPVNGDAWYKPFTIGNIDPAATAPLLEERHLMAHALLAAPELNPRSLFLTNLLLLGFDPSRPVRSSMTPFTNDEGFASRKEEEEEEANEKDTPLDADMFARGGMAGTARAFECTARFLFGIIKAREAKEVGSPTSFLGVCCATSNSFRS